MQTLGSLVYADPATWTYEDAYAIYRFFTHAFSKAGRYRRYANGLRELDLAAASPELRNIIREILSEIPGAASFLSRESQRALAKNDDSAHPVYLNEHPVLSTGGRFGVYL